METLEMYVELENAHNTHFPDTRFTGYRDLYNQVKATGSLHVPILTGLTGDPTVHLELFEHEVEPRHLQGDETILWDRAVAALFWDEIATNSLKLFYMVHTPDISSVQPCGAMAKYLQPHNNISFDIPDNTSSNTSSNTSNNTSSNTSINTFNINNITPAQLLLRERAFRYLVTHKPVVAQSFLRCMQVFGPMVGTCGYVEIKISLMEKAIKSIGRHNVGLAQIRPDENLPPAFLRAAMCYDPMQHVIVIIRNVDHIQQASVFVVYKHLIIIDPDTKEMYINE